MTWAADWLYPIVTVMVGYLVLGITGFGSSLVIVPLLAWKWPLPEVVALAMMLDAPASALMGGLNLKQVSFVETRRLLPGLLLGMLGGLWLVAALPPRWPLLMLGAYVAFTGFNALRSRAAAPAPWPAPAAHLVGVVAGAVQMMFGTAGPVVLAWLQRRLADVRVMRATTPAVMLIAICAVLVVMALAGRLSSAVLWQRWAVLIGVALAAVAIGNRLSRRVPAPALRRVICALLVVSGLMLVWRSSG